MRGQPKQDARQHEKGGETGQECRQGNKHKRSAQPLLLDNLTAVQQVCTAFACKFKKKYVVLRHKHPLP